MSQRASSLLASVVLGLVSLLAAVGAYQPPRRLMLVSFDGAGGLEYERQRDAGTFGPDGFLRAEREGFSARRLEVVSPSLTAVSHASISTGAWPSATGIVNNLVHRAGTPLRDKVSGFDLEPEVPAIWELAARGGRRVAALGWPGISNRTPRTTVAVGFRWAEPRTRPTFFRGPIPEGAAAVALPAEVRSYSPPRPFEVEVPAPGGERTRLSLVALDTTDDGRRGYDEVALLAPGGTLAGRLRPGTWLPIAGTRPDGSLEGRWAKLVTLSPDLSRVLLYVSALCATEATPPDFQRTLDARLGFWPGPPDPWLLEAENDPKGFLEQVARFSDFLASAGEIALRRGDWDLLFAYQPIVDEASHVLLLTDPRQPGYTRERAAAAAAALREVWRIADRSEARYLRFAPTGDVVTVSDHGMRAIVRTVYPLELMRRHGFVKLERNGDRVSVASDSPADVLLTGGTAQVVVNRAGALPGGVVPAARADRLVEEIAAAFRGLVDETGAPVFETVARPSEGRPPGLDHPNSGDLVLVAAGPNALRPGLPPGGEGTPPFGVPEIPGQHGFGPDPELDGIFFHVGEGIGAARVEKLPSVAVAPRVAGRLGIRSEPVGNTR